MTQDSDKKEISFVFLKTDWEPHRQPSAVSTGTKQGRVWQSCCLSIDGPAEEFELSGGPQGPSGRAFEKGWQEAQPRECKYKEVPLTPSNTFKKINQLRILTTSLFSPTLKVTSPGKIVPTFSLKQGSPTQAVVSTVY